MTVLKRVIFLKMLEFEAYQTARITRLESFLKHLLPEDHSLSLFKAMRYVVLNGGKRIRPLLVYATGEALSAPAELLDAPAAAVEFIHCYSLVHDDLPAMDNDDLRRGKPTCHKAFDEATAILTGDALLTLAFKVLSDATLNPVSAEQRIHMIQVLAEKSGMQGMIKGQVLDMTSEGKQETISFENLCEIHHKKTGALIEAAVTLGAIAAIGSDSTKINQNIETMIPKLQAYAQCVGLAFQIQDDILDVISDAKTLGKSAGKDQQQNKATFPSLLGIEQSKQHVQALHQKALENIQSLALDHCYLEKICDFLINRKY